MSRHYPDRGSRLTGRPRPLATYFLGDRSPYRLPLPRRAPRGDGRRAGHGPPGRSAPRRAGRPGEHPARNAPRGPAGLRVPRDRRPSHARRRDPRVPRPAPRPGHRRLRVDRRPHLGRAAEHVRVGGSEPIPRLEDLLEELPGARFNIDLKARGTAGPVADLVLARGEYDRFCVGSFSEPEIRRFRRLTEGQGRHRGRPVRRGRSHVGAARRAGAAPPAGARERLPGPCRLQRRTASCPARSSTGRTR